jgi:hypothetical protein
MRRTIWLVVAAILAAAGAPAAHAQQAPASGVPAGSAGYTYVQPAENNGPLGLGIGRRLSNLFRRNRTEYPTVQPQRLYQSAEPPLAAPPTPGRSYAPIPSPAPAAPGAPPGVMPISHTVQKPALPEAPKETVLRVAIADDASWVIGELQYVHTDGGTWVVRYAPLDREDRYGGAIALAKGVDMRQFREGDLVFVKGSILDEGRSSRHVGAPLYRVTSISLNERPGEP